MMHGTNIKSAGGDGRSFIIIIIIIIIIITIIIREVVLFNTLRQKSLKRPQSTADNESL